MDHTFKPVVKPADDPDDDPEVVKVSKCTQNSSPFIVGGNEAGLHEFPHMALLVDESFWPICGGTIISENFVLTAAHCVTFKIGGKRYKLSKKHIDFF